MPAFRKYSLIYDLRARDLYLEAFGPKEDHSV
jgi:hypothetical protein